MMDGWEGKQYPYIRMLGWRYGDYYWCYYHYYHYWCSTSIGMEGRKDR